MNQLFEEKDVGPTKEKVKKLMSESRTDESPVGDITDDVITPAVSHYEIQN